MIADVQPVRRVPALQWRPVLGFLGRLILFGVTFALIHHLLGGIKHLFWDMGYGFEKTFATRVAKMQPVAAAILTVLVWIIGYLAR